MGWQIDAEGRGTDQHQPSCHPLLLDTPRPHPRSQRTIHPQHHRPPPPPPRRRPKPHPHRPPTRTDRSRRLHLPLPAPPYPSQQLSPASSSATLFPLASSSSWSSFVLSLVRLYPLAAPAPLHRPHPPLLLRAIRARIPSLAPKADWGESPPPSLRERRSGPRGRQRGIRRAME